MEHQDLIQKKWDKTWGDRLNELVIIGPHLDSQKVKDELLECLCNDAEIGHYLSGGKFSDEWPLEI
jgi:hypothetical protein